MSTPERGLHPEPRPSLDPPSLFRAESHESDVRPRPMPSTPFCLSLRTARVRWGTRCRGTLHTGARRSRSGGDRTQGSYSLRLKQYRASFAGGDTARPGFGPQGSSRQPPPPRCPIRPQPELPLLVSRFNGSSRGLASLCWGGDVHAIASALSAAKKRCAREALPQPFSNGAAGSSRNRPGSRPPMSNVQVPGGVIGQPSDPCFRSLPSRSAGMRFRLRACPPAFHHRPLMPSIC